MTRFFVLTLFILLVVATGCTRKLTETDASVPLEVSAGNTFDIVLAANPTTGYEWRLVEELNEAEVQLIGQEYKADQPVTIGSGGLDIWTFRAVAPGTSQIVFGYFPPDGSNVPDQTTTFTVVVK